MADDVVMMPRRLLTWAIDYLSEDMTCDHAVNICNCETQAVVLGLKLALDGKRQCPDCNGEGFIEDENGHWPTAGALKCETCGSSGAVDINKE